MREKNGGPAFPVPAWAEESGTLRYNAPGLSLRDYFAAKAMQAIAAADAKAAMTTDDIAMESYLLADAMLRRREN